MRGDGIPLILLLFVRRVLLLHSGRTRGGICVLADATFVGSPMRVTQKELVFGFRWNAGAETVDIAETTSRRR